MQESASTPKSIHGSFRIPAELKNRLQEEAYRQDIHLNTLVTRILSKYVFFDIIADQVEALTVNGPVFAAMLDAITLEGMERIGKEVGASLVMRTFSFMNISCDIETLIVRLFEPGAQYSRWYKFNVVTSGSTRKLMFAHNHGRKCSAFLGSYLGSIIESATGTQPRLEVGENIVTISVLAKKTALRSY